MLQLVQALQREQALGDQQTQLNPSANAQQFWDVLYQFLALFFALAPSPSRSTCSGSPGRARFRRIGLDFRRFGGDLGRGILLFVVIGVPGLALYAAGRALGITVQVDASPLDPSWWTVPLLVLAGAARGPHRGGHLHRLPLRPAAAARAGRGGRSSSSTAALRGAYHAYQGFGPIIGNFAMGVVFGWCYRRWGRVMPLVIAHTLLDIVAFVGYPLAAALWPGVFAPPAIDAVAHSHADCHLLMRTDAAGRGIRPAQAKASIGGQAQTRLRSP